MMTKTHALSRLRRLLFAPAAAAFVAALAPAAFAQPTTRGAPVLKTPGKRPDTATPTPAAVVPTAPTPAAKPGTAPAVPGAAGGAPAAPAAGAGAGAAEDPMAAANVKMGPKEIEFKPKGGNFSVNFNLDDADLPDLVKAISNITGRRFIYGGKLRQIKATVYSPEKITAAEAYSAFLSILETNGMTVIPHGRFLKIVETPGVVTETTPIFGTAAPVPNEDRYITRLYRLAHIDANEASNVLTKFKSKEGDITLHPQGNLLIITETGANIQRMLRIIEEIDVGGAGEQIYVEPVNYTSAAEIATKLNDLLDLKKGGAPGGKGGAGGGGGGARIVADERGNSLIIVANDPDYRRLLELINRLDVKQSGDGEIRVTLLQHAACKELSQTLNQILGGAGGGGGGAGGARPGGAGGARPGVPGAAGGAGGGDEVFEGRVRVTCDEATNSLVSTSSLRDYAQLRNVIDQLDKARRQVFIEAVIMDVNIDRTLDYGLSYHAGAPVPSPFGLDNSLVYGGNHISGSLGFPNPTDQSLQALALGIQGPAIQGLASAIGISIPAFGVAMHALALDGDTNVLATPHILATDNIPAEISIGQNIPLQTNVGLPTLPAGLTGQAGGQAAALAGLLGGGGLGGSFGGQRQDVGTRIKVIPHVNDSDQVRLELSEEISEAGAAQGTLGAIPINKRTANTTLIVRDQQTVVIGGLVRDFASETQTKIPILGDIPLIGNLFKQTVKKKQKANLLLILTPYVIRDQDDLRAIFERKMEERQEFLDRYFVFSDSAAWKPPRDFGRSNGLVEHIRQSMIAQEEKARLEEESKPKARKFHEPGQPIPMPSLGGRGGGGAGAPGAAGNDDNAPAAPGTPPPRPPRVRNPQAPQLQPRNIDRVE
jgi:general secretion pathway protein D